MKLSDQKDPWQNDDELNSKAAEKEDDNAIDDCSLKAMINDKHIRYFNNRHRAVVIFITFLAACIISFIGTDLAAMHFYYKENTELIESVADNIVDEMYDEVRTSYDFSVLNSITSDYMGKFSKVQGMQFFLCNSQGECVACSDSYDGDMESVYLSDLQRDNIRHSNSFNPSLAGIRITNYSISRAKSFQVDVRGTSEEYYVLIVYPNENYRTFLIRLITFSVILFVIVVTIAIIILITQNKAYIKFFTIYSEIVKRYAKDDFSVKIPVPIHTKSDYFIEMIEATNQLAYNIETSEERRKQFISNVSHELRTPMTSICGFVDGILDGTIPEKQQRKYLTIVSQETRRLKNMIQSMLNLTRIESGSLQLPKSKFNITDVVVRTLLLFEDQINSKGVEVECDLSEPYEINANKDYIQQVIYNLTENATKFVNENGKITVTIGKCTEEAGMLDISIKNSGDGLASDEIPRIFDRFYKTDRSRSKDKTGLGLGLTICRRIVHLHNGRILVKSVEGEYTQFTVRLPF
jgi:signal transduction histidine kinase